MKILGGGDSTAKISGGGGGGQFCPLGSAGTEKDMRIFDMYDLVVVVKVIDRKFVVLKDKKRMN